MCIRDRHQLTENGRYKLRFDLQFLNHSWSFAEYSSFSVDSEAANYTLEIGGYWGNAGDALSFHNGKMFTTYDRDNDVLSSENCAVLLGGGFWYQKCGYCFVNRADGKWKEPSGEWHGLQSTRLWLTC